MESMKNGKDALISSIKTDASTQEKAIIQDAQTLVAEKEKYAGQRIATILEDARKEADERSREIQAKVESETQLELKRRSLHARKKVIDEILKRVENRFTDMLSQKQYEDILLGWITEAAIGLDVDSAVINASADERVLINSKLIGRAVKKIQEVTDKTVALELSNGPALIRQGIVLTSTDGRMAYNCQVLSRISRKERAINKMIYDAIFKEES